MVRLLFISILLIATLVTSPLYGAVADHWILVDVGAHTLAVYRGETLEQLYPRVAIGRSGAANERRRGDGVTPTGEFHITRIDRASKFQIFMELDFPNEEHTERAYQHRLIDLDTYYSIRMALRDGRLPPQNTPLGGMIGIHGLGQAAADIHRSFDWTQGCVALTNSEIEQLASWVRVGTRVVVR